jgi:hypothetical protein
MQHVPSVNFSFRTGLSFTTNTTVVRFPSSCMGFLDSCKQILFFILQQGDQIEGLLSAGWTNERHSSYISSMEASFVEQLYGQENCNYDANKNNLRNIAIKCLPENPWVRRFKPRGSCVNHRGTGMEPIVDDYGSGTDTVREKVRTHAGVVKTSVIIGKSKGHYLVFPFLQNVSSMCFTLFEPILAVLR